MRREHKKGTERKRSGAGTDAVHVPKLWYYKLLLFLSDQEEVRLSITSLDSPTEDSQQTGASHADDDVLSECEEDEYRYVKLKKHTRLIATSVRNPPKIVPLRFKAFLSDQRW
ncbi:hypothetical protein J6590_067594 [Homalodisca vitripennis]|nr:hypothetical protein J6590_067594 [Homalodisca vitripennis]